MKYTEAELDTAAIADLLADAAAATKQAYNGPYYPDRGISMISLLAYADKCRAQAAKYTNGGAHKAISRGQT